MQGEFWRLESPSSPARRAEWDHGRVELETITCPVSEGHQRSGRRLTDLSVVLPRGSVESFVWTWQSECLMQDHVLGLFRSRGFTGFEVKPVTARFDGSSEKPPTLWELVLTGWAGMASSASGLRLDEAKSCAVCGHLTYTGLVDPGHLIDKEKWDGSDFFMVWPFPRLVFVTQRVVDAIRENKLTGVRAVRGWSFEPVTDEFSPGRLSYSMPEGRARELGEPLGIY